MPTDIEIENRAKNQAGTHIAYGCTRMSWYSQWKLDDRERELYELIYNIVLTA